MSQGSCTHAGSKRRVTSSGRAAAACRTACHEELHIPASHPGDDYTILSGSMDALHAGMSAASRPQCLSNLASLQPLTLQRQHSAVWSRASAGTFADAQYQLLVGNLLLGAAPLSHPVCAPLKGGVQQLPQRVEVTVQHGCNK